MTKSYPFDGTSLKLDRSAPNQNIDKLDYPLEASNQTELITWLLGGIVYGSWLLATINFHQMPILLAFFVGGFIVAWHGSFQHETIHGHPTKSVLINSLLGCFPLGLLNPYFLYRSSHIEHHETNELTNPINDPESFYVTESMWNSSNKFKKQLLKFHNTLSGRLLIGPFLNAYYLVKSEIVLIANRNFKNLKAWLMHLPLVGLLLYWVIGVCHIEIWQYLLCFVYSGLSLTLLRSFNEHRLGANNQERSAIVEAALPFQLLYLNNNYHYVHHNKPGLPWYKVKGYYELHKNDILEANGNFRFKGYSEIFKKFLLKSKGSPVYPEHGS